MITVHNTTDIDIAINEKIFRAGESAKFSEKEAEDLIRLGCSYDVEVKELKKEEKEEIEE
jgi:hypothetical protein